MGVEFLVNPNSLWERFIALGSQNPLTIASQLFLNGGWIIFLILFIHTSYLVWLNYRQGQFAKKWKFVLLAVDIPKNNEQTPKAVENVFAALAGIYTKGNLIDVHWKGKITESFSFEIVSLEGYIQFLIRTIVIFRDLAEAAIYSQYPEAEITEVEDYAAPFSNIRFPNNQYELWGTELVLVKDYPYPIRTYPDFEHKLSGEFLDPMANLLEVLGRIGAGEQLWLQLIVTPQPPGWGEKAKKTVKSIMGETYASPETLTDKLTKPLTWIGEGATMVSGAIFGAGEEAAKKETDQWKMFRLSPGERLVFENVQRKLSKLAFRLKFRMIYLADKQVFSKGRGVAAVMGAIQQFNVSDSNGFKPGRRTKTAADYFWVKARVAQKQNKLLRQYVFRSNYYGDDVRNMLFSTEELASLWHFPVMTVKAPAVEKIASKKAAPPTRLPYSDSRFIWPQKEAAAVSAATLSGEAPAVDLAKEKIASIIVKEQEAVRKKPAPPANLPTV